MGVKEDEIIEGLNMFKNLRENKFTEEPDLNKLTTMKEIISLTGMDKFVLDLELRNNSTKTKILFKDKENRFRKMSMFLTSVFPLIYYQSMNNVTDSLLYYHLNNFQKELPVLITNLENKRSNEIISNMRTIIEKWAKGKVTDLRFPNLKLDQKIKKSDKVGEFRSFINVFSPDIQIKLNNLYSIGNKYIHTNSKSYNQTRSLEIAENCLNELTEIFTDICGLTSLLKEYVTDPKNNEIKFKEIFQYIEKESKGKMNSQLNDVLKSFIDEIIKDFE